MTTALPCLTEAISDPSLIAATGAALDIARGAPAFELGEPSRRELRAIFAALCEEQRTLSLSVNAAYAAWLRGALLALVETPEALKSRASSSSPPSLLITGRDGRRVAPAFVVFGADSIELLWVWAPLRRRGLGRLLVRELCEESPRIERVIEVLPEARAFWDAVGRDTRVRRTHVPSDT
jgi:hypothetical protein